MDFGTGTAAGSTEWIRISACIRPEGRKTSPEESKCITNPPNDNEYE